MQSLKVRIHDFLRRGDAIFKTDVVYLLKGGSWLGFGQVVATGSSLALAILFANLLPPATYGTYKYILSIAGLLGITTLSGVNLSFAQAAARGAEGTFLPALHAKIRWGLIGLSIALSMAGYYLLQENTTLAIALCIAAIFIPLTDPLSLFTVYLQSKKQFRESILSFSITQILACGTTALTLLFTDNLFVILISYFAPFTLLRYFFHRRTLRRFPPNGAVDPAVISQGKHLSFIGLASSAAAYLDDIIIFQTIGAAPVALFGLASAPIEQVRALGKNLPTLALPQLTHRSIQEINALLYPRLLFFALLGVGFAGAYSLFAPYLFAWIFPHYVDGVFISQLFAFIMALQFPGQFFSAVMQSKIDRIPQSWLYWGSVPQVLLVGSLLVLTPLFGLYGVIASKYIQQLGGLIITTTQWIILKQRDQNPHNRLPDHQ